MDFCFFQKLSNRTTAPDFSPGLLFCAPSGARFSRVTVPNAPGSGKDIAESKGVRREAESKGSWMWGTY